MKIAVTITFSTDDDLRLQVDSVVNRFGQDPKTELPKNLASLIHCAVLGTRSGIDFYIKERRPKHSSITYHEPKFD